MTANMTARIVKTGRPRERDLDARDLVEHVGEGAGLYLRDGLRAMVADSDGRTALLMPMRGAA
jgi:hypothetical protein